MSDPDADQVYRPFDKFELSVHTLYRERIVQEDNLINHRMVWMLLSQAFMIALWGAMAQKALGSGGIGGLKWAMAIIAIVAGLFAIGSFSAIYAAQKEIKDLRTQYLKMFQPHDTPASEIIKSRKTADDRLPGLTGSKSWHFLGHVLPRCMPIFLLCLWGVLLGVSVIF